MWEQGPEAVAGVREGQVLAGKYRVERVLGAGGMGVVVAAHHLQLDERVAIKFLLPETLQSAETIARFSREARAAAKIKSEHVVRVIDVGTLDNGAPYTVMEFLDGTDLSGWLRKHGALAIELAVDFILQACEAVAEAHVLGIVHRDLKPANLFVIRRPDGQLSVKVLDFGISKLTGGAATTGAAMTRTGGPMGSPLYMSPEQMHSAGSVDARSDLWSLGVVLYEALAGVPPFVGDTVPEVCAKILTTSPRSLRSFRPEVPPGLEALIQRCLEKERERRFSNVGELAAPLAPFGSEQARLSAKRIAGVFRGKGGPPAPPEPFSEAVAPSPETTLTAPELNQFAPNASPQPPLVATAHPVASSFAAHTWQRRGARTFAWAGAGVVALTGAAIALLARGSHIATDIPTPPASIASVVAPPETSLAEAASAVGSAVTSPSAAGSPTATPSDEVPRRRSHQNAGPRPSTSASARSTTSAVPTAPPMAPAAPANTCRLVSSFDAKGREHFKQVCDGN